MKNSKSTGPMCDRCLGPAPVHTTSRFNTQTICMPCVDIEEAHPKYKEAADVEAKAVVAGNLNFPGVGLPEDLRLAMFNKIVASEKHDTLFTGAIWGMNDGRINVDEPGDAKCALCLEPHKSKSVEIADVEDSLQLCLYCGKLFATHARKVIMDWVEHDLAERILEIDSAIKDSAGS